MQSEQGMGIQRAGVIGTGRIANRFMPEAGFADGIHVQAVYNPHLESAGRFAALCHTADDGCDLLRIIFAAGNIVQEKQGFSACTGNIVDAHCHTVDSHGIMTIQQESQFQLRSHTVRAGYQRRFLHVFEFFHGKCTGKSAKTC